MNSQQENSFDTADKSERSQITSKKIHNSPICQVSVVSSGVCSLSESAATQDIVVFFSLDIIHHFGDGGWQRMNIWAHKDTMRETFTVAKV